MLSARYQTLVFNVHSKSLTLGSLRFFDLRCKILTFIFLVAFSMAPPLIVPKNFKHNFFSLIVFMWIILLLQVLAKMLSLLF